MLKLSPLKFMAEKKHYLIKVWQVSNDKKIDDFLKDKHDGFDLVQEKIIKSYENNIKNLHVPKGLRSTYEEVEAPKEDSKKSHA